MRVLLCKFWVLALVFGCSGGASQSPPTSSPPVDTAGGDDGADAEILIPLGLLDPTFLAEASRRAGDGTGNQDCTAITPSPIEPGDDLGFEKQIIGAGPLAVAQMRCLLLNLQDFLNLYFGPKGVFAGRQIKGKVGKPVLVQLPANATDGADRIPFARIGLLDKTRFQVEFFRALVVGQPLRRTVNIAYRYVEGKTDQIEGTITSFSDAGAVSLGRSSDVIFSTEKKEITTITTLAQTAHLDHLPARTKIDVAWAGGNVQVSGAYVWKIGEPVTTPSAPRYVDLRSGDRELFQGIGIPGAGVYLQRMAFLPVEGTGGLDPAAPDATPLFATYAYDALVKNDVERAPILANPQRLTLSAAGRRVKLPSEAVTPEEGTLIRDLGQLAFPSFSVLANPDFAEAETVDSQAFATATPL